MGQCRVVRKEGESRVVWVVVLFVLLHLVIVNGGVKGTVRKGLA